MLLSYISQRNSSQLPSFVEDSELGRIDIVYKNQASIRLSLKTNGQIILSAPNNISIRTLEKFLDKYRPSLVEHIKKINNQRKKYINGSKVGRHHKIKIIISKREAISVTDSIVKISITNQTSQLSQQQLISQAISRTLKKEAQHYLPKRLRYFALKYGLAYDKVRLNHAKTRWGSCSNKGTISLNIALMELPDRLIDYVILHELAHTKHMNHSASFWQYLDSICPDSKLLKTELKKYSPYV